MPSQCSVPAFLMLSLAAARDIGLLGINGSVIAAGIFGILAAPFISRLSSRTRPAP